MCAHERERGIAGERAPLLVRNRALAHRREQRDRALKRQVPELLLDSLAAIKRYATLAEEAQERTWSML